MSKKKTLQDIFDDDDFGLLDSKAKSSNIKTDEDRLIDVFEEINLFVDKNSREPNQTSMSEYGLMAKLKTIRENEAQKRILKPYDKHNLLGHVEMEKQSIDDILNDDELDLLSDENDLDIFKFKHTPKQVDRGETDFVAQPSNRNLLLVDKNIVDGDVGYMKIVLGGYNNLFTVEPPVVVGVYTILCRPELICTPAVLADKEKELMEV